MQIPPEVSHIETKLAETMLAVAEVDHYEVDLISFVSAHKVLALQFALIVCTPVAWIAYEMGRHFHS